MLKFGKLTFPFSNRPFGLLGSFGKIFEKILLNIGLGDVNKQCLLRDEQFCFRPTPRNNLLEVSVGTVTIRS